MTHSPVEHRIRRIAEWCGGWLLLWSALTASVRADELVSTVVEVASKPTRTGDVLRPQDELWYVGTRHLELSDAHPSELPSLEVFRYRDATWTASCVDALVAPSSPDMTTLFYFHGNRVSVGYAVTGGRLVYRRVTDVARWRGPLRFVIWSWPSDKICGQLRDFRAKATRSDVDALFLAAVLSRMPKQVPVSMLAYSFGARIVTGCLHLRGGGELLGNKLHSEDVNSMHRVRTVFCAAAVHHDWLYSGGKQSRAVSQMNQFLVLYNSRDPLLMHYRFLERNSRPAALGFVGLEQDRLADQSVVFHQRDVRDVVGLSHSELRYFASTELVRQLSRYLQWKTRQ